LRIQVKIYKLVIVSLLSAFIVGCFGENATFVSQAESIPATSQAESIPATSQAESIPATSQWYDQGGEKVTATATSSSIYLPTITFRVSHSRGYLTTPTELTKIADKARRNIQPYTDAVDSVLEFVGAPSYWPGDYEKIGGAQSCDETEQPGYIYEGSPLVYAKAIAYNLTGDSAYAHEVRRRILDLLDTYGYGGEVYSGANQCILNLSWYLPSWIMAADLIEDYPGWTMADKRSFQQWLAEEIYKKTAWSSRNRKNNWGSAGSTTSAMIADYLWDSPYLLEGDSPSDAFVEHKQKQIDRMNTVWQGDSPCDIWGIQPYGGIPDELIRGSSGCDAMWIVENDASWSYSITHLKAIVMHAEVLLRRGDDSLYENVMDSGGGSLIKAIHFIIDNPADPGKSTYWRDSAKSALEITYRYYRDKASGEQLGIGQSGRYIGGIDGQMLHFGTLTHGFAPNENPGSPPTVPPP
jgi:hypothetical protein